MNGIPSFFALSPWKNPPAVEAILSLVWQLEDACQQQAWQDHWHKDQEHCPCLFCEHTNGLWYNLRCVESALEAAVHMFPAQYRRWAALARDSGTEQDLKRAAEMEARADELERKAGAGTAAIPTHDPPMAIVLNAMRKQAKAKT